LAGKIVRVPFRILPRDIAVPILQGPLRGKKWIVGAYNHGCWLGSYELEMQKRMVKEVRHGGNFYDIGANAGFYSLLASVLIDSGWVYSFEPLPANLIYLRKHLEMNKIKNVKLFDLALSNEVGTAFFEVEATRGMGKLGSDGTMQVQTSTIDALLHEELIAPPDSIKMDIEGAENLALLGAKECFARYKPKLFLALHGKDVHEECCRLLSSWHYEFEYISQESLERAELFAYPRLKNPTSL